ncbi:Nup133 N terminal like-domain-containing protein [Polychytrium aggregatum]|uniref:Nup133 N terminal like-domain-containing protein n=1 Tax=Polychytrium aggregatum TaxID=110093 RepID=UPI0022FEA1A3|nr:Nup133 N terminal like-domain-containing protein [Polychytrium aggregatum]KAI9204573.1 Nup133 N terminal like-domain-containing protein [Polychytrium aggregatum]
MQMLAGQYRPQLVQSTSTLSDAEPIVRDVSDAILHFEEKLRQDRFEDLYEQLKKSPPAEDRAKTGYGLEKKISFKLLEKEVSYPLPKILYDEYDGLKYRSFMGLFPELRRAWMTIDTKLYIWNYEDESEIYVLGEEQDQIITSVCLAKPVAGVFVEQIEYLIVVATPIEITLYGVAYSDASKGLSGGLSIYPTQMSAPSDSVTMTALTATRHGRIFACGANGCLYELQYQAEEGWFTRKFRKLNHSKSTLSFFVPTLFGYQSDDPIEKIACDDSRNLIYTLTSSSQIEVSYLGDNGLAAPKRYKCSNIYLSAQRLLDKYPNSSSLDQQSFKIFSIHPLSSSESKTIHLLAVTTTGVRLYFTTRSDVNSFADISKYSGPTELRLLAVRPPPTPLPTSPIPLSHYHVSTYSNGVFVAAETSSGNDGSADVITTVCPDPGVVTRSNRRNWSEQFKTTNVSSRIWAIHELPSRFFEYTIKAKEGAGMDSQGSVADFQLRPTEDAGLLLNEFATQMAYPQRKYLVLTNEGVSIYVKLRPIDILQRLLMETMGPHNIHELLTALFTDCGHEQAAAMCLAIACSHPCVMDGLRTASRHSNVTAAAAHLYADLKTPHPAGPEPNQSMRVDPNRLGTVVPRHGSSTPRSDRYNGLALYVARLLKPIWEEKIFKKRPSAVPSNIAYSSNVSVADLSTVQRNLQSLHRFLAEYPGLMPNRDQSTLIQNDLLGANEALMAEREMMLSMSKFVKLCIEGTTLILLLNDHNLENVMKTVSKDEKQSLGNLTYQGLISGVNGLTVIKHAIRGLINYQIDQQTDIEIICSTLLETCPSFYNVNDFILNKAADKIQSVSKGQASHTISRNESLHLLGESLKLLSSVVDKIPDSDLDSVCDMYIKLRYYTGAIELWFQYIQRNFPVLLDGNLDQRLHVYGKITHIIQSAFDEFDNDMNVDIEDSSDPENRINSTLEVALATQDNSFHDYLYDWFFRTGRHEYLLQIKTQQLERYLRRGATVSGPEGTVKADLLWKYYVRTEQHAKAAKILELMAETDRNFNPQLDLAKRIEYLSRALGCAKSSGNSEMIFKLEEKFEVAEVQMELFSAIQGMGGFAERHEALQLLNDRLLDCQEMYDDYATPLELYDLRLLILNAAGHKDLEVVCDIWRAIIIKLRQENGGNWQGAILSKVADLGSRLYPNENVFPLRFLCNLLETLAIPQDINDPDSVDPGWVIEMMLAAQVSHETLFQTLDSIFVLRADPWTDPTAQTVLIRDIGYLLTKWLDRIAAGDSKDQFPAKSVDEAIAVYLMNVADVEVVASLRLIQERIRANYA